MTGHERNDDEAESFPWGLGVFDAHCHPTDTVSSIKTIPLMKAKALTIMSSRDQDQNLVAHFADAHGVTSASISALVKQIEPQSDTSCQVVPSFGWHPWFSHQIYDDGMNLSNDRIQGLEKRNHYKAIISPLPTDDEFVSSFPDPRSLSSFLAQTRRFLEKYPYALIGEIGLDRAFRIPDHQSPSGEDRVDSEVTPGGRDGRRLTPYRVCMDHQRKIFKAQLNLAGELSRPVSVHGVAAHGVLFETLRETWKGHETKIVSKRSQKRKTSNFGAQADVDEMKAEDQMANAKVPKPFPPRICLHSYSGPPETLKQYLHPSIPATIYLSFSQLVNFSSPASAKAIEVIKAIPDDRILAESDLHSAGKRMDDLLEQMIRSICQIKNWSLEKGVRQLRLNWLRFVFGETLQ